jgi:hypothetical protein
MKGHNQRTFQVNEFIVASEYGQNDDNFACNQ